MNGASRWLEAAASSLINQPVHVEIDLAGGKKRYIHGLVSSFTSRGTQQVLSAYTAIVRPWFWFLSLWQDCKIFQNKTVSDIVEEVFKGCGYTDFTLKLYNTYQPREYCVQYRESSMDFVSPPRKHVAPRLGPPAIDFDSPRAFAPRFRTSHCLRRNK